MKSAKEQLHAAEIESDTARSQLTGTLIHLQKRLTPTALVREARHELKEKAGEWAHETLDAIKARPVTTAGFVAGVVILFLRDDAWRALTALFNRETESDDDELNERMIGEGTG